MPRQCLRKVITLFCPHKAEIVESRFLYALSVAELLAARFFLAKNPSVDIISVLSESKYPLTILLVSMS